VLCFADAAKGDGRDPGTKFGMGFVCYFLLFVPSLHINSW